MDSGAGECGRGRGGERGPARAGSVPGPSPPKRPPRGHLCVLFPLVPGAATPISVRGDLRERGGEGRGGRAGSGAQGRGARGAGLGEAARPGRAAPVTFRRSVPAARPLPAAVRSLRGREASLPTRDFKGRCQTSLADGATAVPLRSSCLSRLAPRLHPSPFFVSTGFLLQRGRKTRATRWVRVVCELSKFFVGWEKSSFHACVSRAPGSARLRPGGRGPRGDERRPGRGSGGRAARSGGGILAPLPSTAGGTGRLFHPAPRERRRSQGFTPTFQAALLPGIF